MSLVVAIRTPLALCKGITDSHDQCAHWSRNDRGFLYIALSFFNFHSLHHGNSFCAKRNFPCRIGAIQAKTVEIVMCGKTVLNYRVFIATFLEYALDNCEILDAE